MAIDLKLFERVHSGRGLFAVESISLIYNALTSILILILFSRMDYRCPDVRVDLPVPVVPLPADGFHPYGGTDVFAGILVPRYV